jgi:hypothetical protein
MMRASPTRFARRCASLAGEIESLAERARLAGWPPDIAGALVEAKAQVRLAESFANKVRL